MDALSEALNAVRMTSAIFFNAEFTAPWGFVVPPITSVAAAFAPGAERIVNYHLVTEGNAVVRFPGETEMRVSAGDVVIIAHGDSHTVSNGVPERFIDASRARPGDLVTARFGGGGQATRLVCGFFGCERHADRLFLAGLPTAIKINLRGDLSGAWLEGSIRYLVSETVSGRPGGSMLLNKMAEALFIEGLRRHMEQLPPEKTGWLAAARDPVVGAALALLHREPGHRWTLAELATRGGASRSVLSERFVRFLGEPPLAYLARWRLQLAARKLETTRNSVLEIALDVGYESEAAFSRAFKREFGFPPARYRKSLMGRGPQPYSR